MSNEQTPSEELKETPAEETTGPEAAAEGAAPAQEEDLQALLEDARNKADEHWNQCLLLQAEIENLRKRSAREVENAHKFAVEKFVKELLPVADSMEMGVAAAQAEDADVATLREGSEMMLNMFRQCLDKMGVEVIDPVGEKFDPELHQAMTMQPSAEHEPNTVLSVMQKGYTLNGRVVRPALVVVSQSA